MPRFLPSFLVMGWSGLVLGQDVPASDRPIAEVVDHYISLELKKAKIESAPLAGDAAFLRRLTLDLVGRIPTLAETESYLADLDPEKKIKLVNRLLGAPGFVRHQANEFVTFLAAPEINRKAAKKSPLQDYLLLSFAENRSWDRIFRELMVPDETDPKMEGAGEFLKGRIRDLNRLTIDASIIFFGVNVSCAQCHDHPHVPAWTQDHFYGMKSFFGRTFDNGGFVAEKDFGLVKYTPNKGQEKVAPVMFLTGKPIADPGQKDPTREEKKKEQDRLDVAKKAKKPPAPASFSLRAQLVATALEERQFFARSIVNRLVHRLFGRGLVMPLDQMHEANPASHPELLTWLARDLADHGYDLRRLIRGLVLSDAYARSSRWEDDNFPHDRYFAMAQIRPLTPMQMAVSLKLATTDPQSIKSDPKTGIVSEAQLETLERNAARLSSLFAQPGDNFQVSVSEAMLFANNEGLNKELLEGAGTLTSRLMAIPDLEKRSDHLAVRTVLSRPARPEEIKALTEYLKRRQDRPEAACQQVIWALLTSAEFRFNH